MDCLYVNYDFEFAPAVTGQLFGLEEVTNCFSLYVGK
jgi:hypothetical protein